MIKKLGKAVQRLQHKRDQKEIYQIDIKNKHKPQQFSCWWPNAPNYKSITNINSKRFSLVNFFWNLYFIVTLTVKEVFNNSISHHRTKKRPAKSLVNQKRVFVTLKLKRNPKIKLKQLKEAPWNHNKDC